jgi:hypothetical protein
MATKQLSEKGADGTTLGQSASDKIAFYGAAVVAQQASAAAGTDAATTQTLANALRLALLNTGIIA